MGLDIIAVEVEAAPLRDERHPWDEDRSPPDLELVLRVDGREVARCEGPLDEAHARCAVDVRVAVGERLTLKVVDRDLLVDDPVGEAELVVGAPAAGRLELPVTGRLKAAHVVARVTPPLAVRYRDHAIGGGVGIGIALLLVLLFRRNLCASWSTDSSWGDFLRPSALCAALGAIVTAAVMLSSDLPRWEIDPLAVAAAGFAVAVVVADALYARRLGSRHLALLLLVAAAVMVKLMLIGTFAILILLALWQAFWDAL